MNKYIYKAKDKYGQVVSGEVETESEYQAAKLIREKDLVVYSIKSKNLGMSGLGKILGSRVNSSDVSAFTRQLATMVNSGLPITDTLLVLRNQAKAGMRDVVVQILADVEGGESLSSACLKHPKVFSSTYVALLRSGEAGGVLDRVLARLADNMEKEQEFKGKVKGAMIYPVVVTVGMFVVALIMMIFVIPKMTSLYTEFGATLPLPTRILMGISSIFSKFWYLVAAVGFGIFYGMAAYRKTPDGRRKIDGLLLKLPIVGELQKQVILTDITRTLSLMAGAGVSVLEALNISSEVVSNMVIRSALKDVAQNVEKGFPVAYSFAKHPDVFPYILSQMISVGEETGKMDEVLEKMSHIFEVESDQKVKGLTAAVEPLIMVVLGLGVAFLVISIILPIYNLTSSF